ncbi:MAG TPA: hypothetical protein VHT71_21690, partial [Methylomirabilota bacterium]|nr:hypothetical protein [Methylomirabilota bacterium]
MSPALFSGGVRAINIGLAAFVEPPRAYGAAVTQLAWRPPAGGDRELGLLLARIEDDADDPIGARVAAANESAIARILRARPQLVDVRLAREVIPALAGRTILHAGAPIEWARMCGPMQGAVIGAILIEGWAANREAARGLADSGAITLAPCH